MLTNIINKFLPTKMVDSSIALPVDLQYHDLDEPLPTTAIGSRKTEVEEVLKDDVIDAGGSVYVNFAHKGESETHFLINSSASNWSADATLGPWAGLGATFKRALYPVLENEEARTNRNDPQKTMFVFSDRYSSFEEAYLNRQANEGRIYIRNNSEEDGEVTIRILRVWG